MKHSVLVLVPKSNKYLDQAYGIFYECNNSSYTRVLQYVELFTVYSMHSENCLFLGGFQSSEILVSTAESAVFTLCSRRVNGRLW